MLRVILKFSTLSILMLIAACAPHDPFGGGNDLTLAPAGKTYPPTTAQVRMIEGTLPEGTYQTIGQLDVGTAWYGDLKSSEKALADRARSVGADAVIDMKLWHQPQGFSWAAPQGSGVAVKLTDPTSVDLNKVPGDWD
jgi:hypothetical protein